MKKLTSEEIRNNFYDFRYLSTCDNPNIMYEFVRYEILLSFRRSLQNVGSECIGSSVTTFDYV